MAKTIPNLYTDNPRTTLAAADKFEVGVAVGPASGAIESDDLAVALAGHLVAGYSSAAADVIGLRRNVVLASPVANDTTSLADVTAFSFPVVANRKYWFRFMIDFTAAAAATGAGFTVNGPALTRLTMIRYVDTSTTGTTLLRANTAYDTPAVAVAASASTGANTAEVAGWIECSAGGNVILRFVSETGGSAITVLAGSVVEYMRVT